MFWPRFVHKSVYRIMKCVNEVSDDWHPYVPSVVVSVLVCSWAVYDSHKRSLHWFERARLMSSIKWVRMLLSTYFLRKMCSIFLLLLHFHVDLELTYLLELT